MMQPINTLYSSGDGSLLFHGGYTSVRVWHNQQFVAECPGRLVGIARDGQTFLTYDKESKSFSAWQSDTGTQIAVSTLTPAGYAANQRYLIEANGLTLTFRDALGLELPKMHTMLQLEFGACDNWSLSPDGHLLAIAFIMDVGGQDTAWGMCFERGEDGQFQKKFDFPVNRFIYIPIVMFCEPYPLLAVSTPAATSLILTNGKPIRQFQCTGEFIAVSPVQQRHVLVHCGWKTWHFYEDEQKREIEESQKILAGAFHPGGNRIAILLKDHSIRIYDIETLAVVDELQAPER
ncbi:MAG TPA: hypothetical protein PLD47_12320 [Aggregatilineales bacterium]|nr:hypothetical protein [Anaerolineales bacterium]HRE48501.1 hypothetical protein [Aggregatilineales bacterium]